MCNDKKSVTHNGSYNTGSVGSCPNSDVMSCVNSRKGKGGGEEKDRNKEKEKTERGEERRP